MSPKRRHFYQGLAAVSLAVLGWDAFQPSPDSVTSTAANRPPAVRQSSPKGASSGPPQFIHLTAVRTLAPGQRLTVHGRVGNLTPNRPATLTLEGPEGTVASAELRDDGTGEAGFSLQHPTPAIAPGTFSWKLRLGASEERILLGVEVRDADRPRVLLLQDHPSVEGARLQRWLADSGSPCTTRTRVSSERYRVAASHAGPVELERLDATALASFDVVIAHASAVDRLSPEEQGFLDAAIRQQGLGLLVLATQRSSPEVSRQSSLVSPWLRSSQNSTNAESGLRETRIEWSPGGQSETPVSVLAMERAVPPAGQALAWDSQDRPVVAWISHGIGRLAGSLVQDSWRWRQHGQGEDYARFWSTVLSAVARPINHSASAWSIEEPSLPLFVDHPVVLTGSGAPDIPSPAAEVRAFDAPAAPAVLLGLGRHASEPTLSRAVFWPVHSGWHTVKALPSGPSLAFYVHPSQALPGVRAQRERDAGERSPGLAASPDPQTSVAKAPAWLRPMIRLLAFLSFLLGAGRLWSAAALCRFPAPGR
jgi:hypothetical protein